MSHHGPQVILDYFDSINTENWDKLAALWTDDVASFKGEFWSFDDVRIAAKPVQKPHPPIWLGTWTAAPRAARRVAKYAAGWQASGLHTPVAAVPEGWAHIEKACAEIGRNPGEIGKAYVNGIVHFGATPEEAWEKSKAMPQRENVPLDGFALEFVR